MKPIKLRMSAFGPYAKEEPVDFSALCDGGLYLIAGDTGAGKTTIFDAICYALYDKPSGDDRSAGMLRSKYADPSTDTWVELTFSHAGKVYTVRRNPEYDRPKLRGTGTTRKPADAELRMPDGTAITRRADVNDKLQEILGVSADQFRQISMIAQGDFRKLLQSKTNERKEIFRAIFKTDLYERFQNRLREELKGSGEAVAQARRDLKLEYARVQAGEGDPQGEDARRLREGAFPEGEAVALLEALIDRDAQALEAREAGIARLDDEIGRLSQLKERGEQQARTRADLEKVRADENAARPVLARCAQALEDARARVPERGRLDEQAAALRQDLKRYEELDDVVKDLCRHRASLKTTADGIAGKQREIDALRGECEAGEARRRELEDAGAGIEKIRNDIGRADERAKKLKGLQDELGVLKEDCERYRLEQAKYAKLQDRADRLKTDAADKRRRFNREQAGLLAETLTEGGKCPVCGSTHHPEPALKSPDAPSEQAVKDAEDSADRAAGEASRQSADVAALRGGITQRQDRLTEELREAFERAFTLQEAPGEVAKARDEVRILRARLEEALAVEKKRKAEKDRLDEALPALRKRLDGAQAELNDLKAGLSSDEEAVRQLTGQADRLRAGLRYPTRDEALKRCEALEKESQAIADALEAAQKAHADAEKKLEGLRQSAETLGKQLEGAEPVDLDRCHARMAECGEERERARRLRDEISLRLETNRGALKRSREISGDISTLDERYRMISALSETANGRKAAGGKEKLMLETWIQQHYFDRIVARANVHLMEMSGSQYELKRCEADRDLRTDHGLELDVVDHYNGSERDVRSLSGGESFIASLSLALGLSEEIQASAGGVRLESMFVDEGFGSLDEDTLQQAMRALSGLTEGDKMVGIISHVAELRDRISRQIVVKKGSTGGSHVAVHTE